MGTGPEWLKNIVKITVTKIKNITDVCGRLLFPLTKGNSKPVCSEAVLILLQTFTESSLRSCRKAFGFYCWHTRCLVFLF